MNGLLSTAPSPGIDPRVEKESRLARESWRPPVLPIFLLLSAAVDPKRGGAGTSLTHPADNGATGYDGLTGDPTGRVVTLGMRFKM
jgi:hypothetical protein